MSQIKVDVKHVLGTISEADINAYNDSAKSAEEKLLNGTGAGNDYLGWVKLPGEIKADFLEDVAAAAKDMQSRCDYVVCIGIGGSYLGSKAVISALSNNFSQYDHNGTKILFAGHNIGEDYLFELQTFLKDKKFGIIVISKSGTTTEPAIAFRLLKEQLEAQAGKEEASKRIVAITDRERGAIRKLATEEGYKTFVIADNIGGRYSVLTPVGLLPIAVAGFDVKELVRGANDMMVASENGTNNAVELYAKTRNALYNAGKKIEILVNYTPKLHYVSEWWKQLYGESEGKDNKGIFPASVDNSTDLHSMGQWIQDGERTIFETVISVEKTQHSVIIPTDKDNLDNLNYIAGKHVDEVNKMAELGTRIAHVDGGVPNMTISIPEVNEYWLGQLIYFFEKACGISGYILGVNPFNQPGVEAYKKNMFALLNKPGYEEESKAIQKKLK